MLRIFEMTSTVLSLRTRLLAIPSLSALVPYSMHGPRCKVYISSTVELQVGPGLPPLHFLQHKDADPSWLSVDLTAP